MKYKQIGKQIQKHRKTKGLKQEEFPQKIGLSTNYLFFYRMWSEITEFKNTDKNNKCAWCIR